MTLPGTPRVVPAANQQTPRAQITMLEADRRICTDLLNMGYPENVVLDIATSFSDKLKILHEVDSYQKQNRDLLAANQKLLARAEEAEGELRRVKQQLQSDGVTG